MRSRPLKNIVRQQWATQHLSALLQKMVDFKEKKHSSTIITLKVCWHWNVKVCSLSHFFFHFSLSKKTTFCKAVFIVTKTPSSDLLWFETHLLNKKGGKIWMKIPQLPHVMILLFDYHFYNNKVLFSLHCCDIIRRLKMLTCNFFNRREVLQMKFFFNFLMGTLLGFLCVRNKIMGKTPFLA